MPRFRNIQGRNEGGREAHSSGAESLWGRRKSQQCHNYFLQYSTFASRRLQFRTWGAKLASCPGRHL